MRYPRHTAAEMADTYARIEQQVPLSTYTITAPGQLPWARGLPISEVVAELRMAQRAMADDYQVYSDQTGEVVPLDALMEVLCERDAWVTLYTAGPTAVQVYGCPRTHQWYVAHAWDDGWREVVAGPFADRSAAERGAYDFVMELEDDSGGSI